jgi:CheY-like chemotaxis protein
VRLTSSSGLEPLRILVVDNNPRVLRVAHEELGSVPQVHLDHATSVAEAVDKIGASFFHVAFVDLRLTHDFESGKEVLQSLAEQSPSCERIAMTRYASEDPASLLEVIGPPHPQAHGLIHKRQDNPWFTPVVDDLLSGWFPPDSFLEGLDGVLADLRDKRKRLGLGGRTDDSIRAELVTILWTIFGRIGASGIARLNEGLRLDMRAMTPGLSPAVVFEATPHVGVDSKGQPILGNRSVVKVGPVHDIRDEVSRFLHTVRFGVVTEARVELLGFGYGDKLGAACYSFAGGARARLDQLDDVAVGAQPPKRLSSERAEEVKGVIGALFGREAKRWYSVDAGWVALGEYFEKELHSQFLRRLSAVRRWAERVAGDLGGRVSRDGILEISSLRLRVPSQDFFGLASFRGRHPACLVHGDMHGGNVLTSDGRVCLIDFAHTGAGPRTIDGAVLHGSIRLWDAVEGPPKGDKDRLVSWISGRVSSERQYLDRLAKVGPKEISTGALWRQIASVLDWSIWENFVDAEEPLSVPEMALSYCLQAARLLTLGVGDVGRLRMLAWFTPLSEFAERTDRLP